MCSNSDRRHVVVDMNRVPFDLFDWLDADISLTDESKSETPRALLRIRFHFRTESSVHLCEPLTSSSVTSSRYGAAPPLFFTRVVTKNPRRVIVALGEPRHNFESCSAVGVDPVPVVGPLYPKCSCLLFLLYAESSRRRRLMRGARSAAVHDRPVHCDHLDNVTARRHLGGVQRPRISGSQRRLHESASRYRNTDRSRIDRRFHR